MINTNINPSLSPLGAIIRELNEELELLNSAEYQHKMFLMNELNYLINDVQQFIPHPTAIRYLGEWCTERKQVYYIWDGTLCFYYTENGILGLSSLSNLSCFPPPLISLITINPSPSGPSRTAEPSPHKVWQHIPESHNPDVVLPETLPIC